VRADESFAPQAEADEPSVPDHDRLEPLELGQAQALCAGLPDRLGPAGGAGARGSFALDGE
jgi:hypothetical protein